MTKFQQRLLKDRQTLWDIVKLFHSDIPDYVLTTKERLLNVPLMMEGGINYTWVTIGFNVPNFGRIDIGIENKAGSSLYGSGINKDMIKAEQVKLSFRAWLFVGDVKYKHLSDEQIALLQPKINELLKSRGYRVIEVDEFYKDYYQD